MELISVRTKLEWRKSLSCPYHLSLPIQSVTYTAWHTVYNCEMNRLTKFHFLNWRETAFPHVCSTECLSTLKSCYLLNFLLGQLVGSKSYSQNFRAIRPTWMSTCSFMFHFHHLPHAHTHTHTHSWARSFSAHIVRVQLQSNVSCWIIINHRGASKRLIIRFFPYRVLKWNGMMSWTKNYGLQIIHWNWIILYSFCGLRFGSIHFTSVFFPTWGFCPIIWI